MKPLFIGQYVLEMLQYGYAELAYQTTFNNLTQAKKDVLREYRKKDGKAMFYIHQAMHESILPRVVATINTKKAWDTLDIAYQGLAKVKKSKLQILRRYFASISMKDS